MAQIDKPNLHFNTVLYTGNQTARNITGVGFQPDMVWTKSRSDTKQHHVHDAVRGATKIIFPDATAHEETQSDRLTAFISDGFSLGTSHFENGNGLNFAAWNWKAGGTGSANTTGSINSTVSVNTTAGFSIVSYTSNATAGATVGHGLGAVPKMIIVKSRTSTDSWIVYHAGNTSAPETDYLSLNTTDGTADDAIWNDTAPTSSVFSLGTNAPVNGSGKNLIAYCFAEKAGYSKFGSYTGNGSSDGSFCYLGFKPAFVMTKRTDGTSGWFMQDNKRLGYNYANYRLFADSTSNESTTPRIDLLSNGFKCRDNDQNGSNFEYIFMAFAENPIVGSNDIPATAI